MLSIVQLPFIETREGNSGSSSFGRWGIGIALVFLALTQLLTSAAEAATIHAWGDYNSGIYGDPPVGSNFRAVTHRPATPMQILARMMTLP